MTEREVRYLLERIEIKLSFKTAPENYVGYPTWLYKMVRAVWISGCRPGFASSIICLRECVRRGVIKS